MKKVQNLSTNRKIALLHEIGIETSLGIQITGAGTIKTRIEISREVGINIT